MKAALSTCLDMLFLSSAFFLTLTLSGGEVRWTTSYFAFRATHFERPFFLCLLLIGTKTAFGLNRGLFASLSRTRASIVSRIAAGIHHLELALRAFYVANTTNITLTVATSVVLLGSLEVVLRYFVQALPGSLANHLATGYTTEPSGIYRVDAGTKMLLMRPNYERVMYFNGYRWRHKTDSMGFRNPLDRPSADVLLLGDSMIYGHGVEETSTLRHYLENLLGEPVANLGVQGASIHQEYQILKRFGLTLHSRYALVFFLGNDISDLTGYLTDAEMQRLLRLPVSDHSTPYVEIRPLSDRPPSHRLRLSAYVDRPYVMKAYEFLKKRTSIAHAEGAGASGEARQSATQGQGDPRMALALQFHLRTLSKIQDLAERHRFRFTHVFIYTGMSSEERVYESILKSYCEAQGIGFYSLRDGFEAAMREGDELFLRGDGHFADHGARLAARLVYRHMMESAGQEANGR
jgi:hypothetical protein